MMAGTLYNQVVLTLQENPTLKKYIKYVYKGLRLEIQNDSMPFIIVEVKGNNDLQLDINKYKNVNLSLDIIAYTAAINPDKGIVGDADYKGVLDIENDVRACLQSSYNLGGYAIDTKFEETQFDYYNAYPNRAMLIPVKILYRQLDGV